MEDTGSFGIDRETDATGAPVRTPWIALDPTAPDTAAHRPLFKLASPVTVVVRPGETLYLPALWLHHVKQRGLTIAVNHWYDMRFDGGLYVLYRHVRRFAGLSDEPPPLLAAVGGADEDEEPSSVRGTQRLS